MKARLFLCLILLAGISHITPITAQKKYDKQLEKADLEFETGNYKEAINILEQKFYKKVKQKLGENSKYAPLYYLRMAKYSWANGVVINFDKNIQKALETSKRVYGEQSTEHAQTLLEAAESLILYGNFLQAREFIETANRSLEAIGKVADNTRARLDLTMAVILSNQGYYRKALTYIEERDDYFRSRTSEKETYIDASGKLQTRKLTDPEIKRRYGDYGKLLTIKAYTLGAMGEVEMAWDAFEYARDWIGSSSQLGNGSLEYVENQFAFANFKIANGMDSESLGRGDHREEGFGRILSNLQKDHSDGHYKTFEIYETLIRLAIQEGQKARFRSIRSDYESAVKQNFPKHSLHFINLQTIEFNGKLVRGKTASIEDEARTVLAKKEILPFNHPKTLMVLDFLYRVSVLNEDFEKANTYIHDILNIQGELYGENSPIYHMTKIKVAHFYINYTNNIEEAEDIYKESFYNIFDKEITPLHPEYTTILNHIALLYEYKDNYKAAGSILQEAAEVSLKKFRDLEDIEYGKELEKIASLQIRMSDYENGKKNLEEAIRIYDLHKLKNDNLNSIYYIQALETKARLMAIEGYFDEAEDLIKEANSVYENTESTEGYNQLETTNDLVGINIFVGHLEEAKKSIEALIPKYEQVYGNNSGKLVSVLINKGRLDLLLGEYSEAEKAARRAYNISINVFGVQSTRSSQVSLLLSELYNTIGDYEKGIENADDALEIARDRFDERSLPVAMALSQLGLARFYNGEDLKETEAILLEAASIIEDKLSATNPRYAEISTYLARVYIQSNKFAEAFNNLSRAEKIWLGITGKRGGRKNINVGRIYVLTGDVYYQQKNYSKAEEEYNKARDVYNRSLSKDHPEYVKVLSKLSRVKYMEGDVQKAKDLLETALASYDLFIKRYFKTLSEREKAKFWFTIKPDYELYNMMALQFLDSDPNALNRMYNNVLTTKALLLNSSVKIRERILSSPDEVLKQKFIAWLEKKEFLTKVLAMGEEEIIENEINPARLSQEIEQLERELSEQSEMFSNDLEESQVTWENVRSTLKKNEVAIEMVRLRYFDHVFTDSIIYAAIYVKNEGDFPKPKVILLKNGDQMEGRYLRAYKNIMINRMGMDPYSYEQFWKPIIEEVGQLSTVYFSPDGVYNQLNLETISLGEGKYVIDNSRIVLVSNTKDLYMHAKKSRKEENEDDIALMFGNPDYYMEASSSNRISPLPGTENEVMQIRALLNEKGVTSDYFTKDEATEEQVKATINPNVLHIATHGFFNPEGKNSRGNSPEEAAAMSNPLLRAGLILSGGGDLMDKTSFNFNIESGILTAQEAMNLNLDKTELVVLSACETASGEVEAGEGVYGLQRAFIVAGAKTLIVSMFKVDDVATQKLMSIFYRKWLQTGKKRESFIEAKKEVRNEFKDPVDWGAFVMVGLD